MACEKKKKTQQKKNHSQPTCPSWFVPAKAQDFDVCFLETVSVQAERGCLPSPWAQPLVLDFTDADAGFLPTHLQAFRRGDSNAADLFWLLVLPGEEGRAPGDRDSGTSPPPPPVSLH